MTSVTLVNGSKWGERRYLAGAIVALVLIVLPMLNRELPVFSTGADWLAYPMHIMVLIMIWRPSGLLAHREPTLLLNDGKSKPQETS